MPEKIPADTRPLAVAARRLELRSLLLLALAFAGIWAFVELADEVIEGETQRIDEVLLRVMRSPADVSDPLGPPWFEEMARDFTALGGTAVLLLLVCATALYLLLLGKRHGALFVLVAVGSGQLLSSLFKWGFDRPRPDLVPHGTFVYTASFPSGHAMMAAITYLTLGALLARMHEPPALKAFFLGTALGLTVLVGISRVYLGVHWPTDVLAGWVAGSAWAIICWLVASWFQRRGTVEDGMEEIEAAHR
ncbi:MAG: phosphatase PAP2 family protein [Burkholderiales bacterium]|nr:phosphatase PAP2 family protein [Burkholderiales bacterium]